MTQYTRALVVLVWVVLGASTLRAADEVILGTQVRIKDPTGVEDRRQVKVVGKESQTALPTPLAQPGAGATLTVVTQGTTPSAQAFVLTGTWVAAGSSGWKYVAGGTAPVKLLLLNRTANGTAQLKVLLKGNVGTDPLTLVPPNLGTEAGIILDDGNGTRYCLRLGGAAGGVVKKNDATQFFLGVRATAPAIEAGCPTTTTTSTTLPSTTTTTTTTFTSTTTLGSQCGQYPTCADSCPTGQACGVFCGFRGCGCFCVPSDECAGSAPTCGGSCPSGQVCSPLNGVNACECGYTCDSSEAPTCGGTCPPGQVCGQGTGTTACTCVTPDNTCGISQGPTCGGTCPSDGACRPSSGGNSCECVCGSPPLCPFVTKWGSTGSGHGQFNVPLGVAVDASGHVFVADAHNDRIQKFRSDGTFVTQWGSNGSGDGQFSFPVGVAVDGSGNVYVADTNNERIQKFTNTGTFLTKWGSGPEPGGVAVDASGNVFVAESNGSRIDKFTNTGTFLLTFGTEGSGDGEFANPVGVAVDGSGNVFVADGSFFFPGNNRIQKFTNAGSFLTKWGSPGSGDGQFDQPQGIAVDGSGNVFVTEGSHNTRIQKFTNTGTFLGQWGCNVAGSADGLFSDPRGLAVDGSGNVYVADSLNSRIQKFACP